MNSAILEAKVEKVSEVTEKFKNAVSCVIVDTRGLTVKESTDLRRQLHAVGVELRVIKNNISSRAASLAGYKELSDIFSGPSAIAFSNKDAVAPAKIVYNFAAKCERLQLKGGFIEKRVVNVAQLAEVAKLPNRDGMLSMLLSVLQAPVRNLAYAVKQIAEKNDTQVSE